MSSLWSLEVPLLEKVIRAAAVYVFLLVALRLTGKRQLGQMSSFDLVVLLVISNIVQNAMIGNDNSITGGFVGAITILLLNYFLARLVMSSKKIEHVVEGKPTVLVLNGKIIDDHLRRELLSRDDLLAAIRGQGIFKLEDVHVAVLEGTGKITALKREKRD